MFFCLDHFSSWIFENNNRKQKQYQLGPKIFLFLPSQKVSCSFRDEFNIELGFIPKNENNKR